MVTADQGKAAQFIGKSAHILHVVREISNDVETSPDSMGYFIYEKLRLLDTRFHGSTVQ